MGGPADLGEGEGFRRSLHRLGICVSAVCVSAVSFPRFALSVPCHGTESKGMVINIGHSNIVTNTASDAKLARRSAKW